MLFNSIDFPFFMALVFTGYWFIFKKREQQNVFLLVASYFFYACWDSRFLFLLLFSTALDYATGHLIFTAQQNRKKLWLTISIVINLGFLFFFKYYNFFAESFSQAFTFFGYKISPLSLSIVLPVGISFYTFHGLSYVIDIFKGRIEPERNFGTYALFVSYFPLLVAGPIERATHLLPQLLKPRVFSYELATDGLRQFLWGLFKKVVIANNCAHYADKVFVEGHPYNGSSLALGVFFFSIQIYADFSGYTDMASGVSKLLGINLLRNFNYPYFATDIADFWRRWHISLSSWFRDYVYIPLGGSRGSVLKQLRNVFVIFLLSGFWHGANSTYIIWGFVHACLFITLLLMNRNRASVGSVPQLQNLGSIVFTFAQVCFAWVFFRAESFTQAVTILKGIFSASLFSMPEFLPKKLLVIIAAFIVVDWLGRRDEYPLASLHKIMPAYARIGVYYALIVVVLLFMEYEAQFIYFQF
ncbi:MBOAT family O-acyltransferase [Flavobacterium sp. RHBU_3]|uniref:MBOAT family O-acyltransferase n=1 Tax=Flavobacterium sp. RHBU_3 TaxID=3391184 RepID=UPI0039846295